MDIRNPRLDDYLDIPGGLPIIYLQDLEIEDLIKYEGYDDFYILPAGVVPPNPAELMSGYVVSYFKNRTLYYGS
jgi:Mrp family chromosome partitioning ATPase